MKSNIVVVMPVARMDWHLAVKCLSWMALIDRKDDPFDLVLLCSTRLSDEQTSRLVSAMPQRCMVFAPKGVDETGYATAPNYMIKSALELMETGFPGRPMLWMEADCVPMRAGWVQEIEAEYVAAGKPFMGDHVLGVEIPHMTGNAVYPPNWRELAPSLATAINKPSHGWDSQCAHETLPQSHRAKTIQQIWRPGTFTPENWRPFIRPETALFHQCKDGSLIDSMADGLDLPTEKALEASTYDRDFPSPRPGPRTLSRVEILIVTFGRDMPFLRYTLDAVKKYAKGFSGVTVAIPSDGCAQFGWVKDMGYKLWIFNEDPGKGMLHHEVMVCRADEICPFAEAIVHLDADTMPWRTFTPEDLAPNGRPLLLRERYVDCGKRNNNRLVWQGTVEKAIGVVPEWETMIRHPNMHVREVYKFMRLLVEQHTGKFFDDYVLSCKNDFPQGFCEHDTLGACALRYFAGAYTVVDYDYARDSRECGVPFGSFQYIYRRERDFFVEFWSHGGIRQYEAWARNFIAGQLPAYFVK